MKKFTQAMLVLLAFLGSTIGAVAQNYPIAFSESTTIIKNTRVTVHSIEHVIKHVGTERMEQHQRCHHTQS